MTEKDLDVAIEKCERIMECDTRTLRNPESENGWIFEKVYDLLKFLRECQFETSERGDTNDLVPRASIEYICRKNTVSTNPYEHKYYDKFIQFMDDPEISDFGRWQHSNGFNTGLVAVKCDLDKVPSVTPKQPGEDIRAMCGECDAWNQYKNYTLPRWIPCSERLPEPGEYYFVTRQYFGWNCTEYREIDIAKYDSNGWHKGDDMSSITVLAWCELDVLKPWEGDKHGKT